MSLFKQKIVTKIAWLVGCITVFSTTAVVVSTYKGAKEIIVKQSLNDVINQTRLHKDSIKSFINQSRVDIDFLSQTPPIAGLLRAGENSGIDIVGNSSRRIWAKRLNLLFANLMRHKPQYESLRYIDFKQKNNTVYTYKARNSTDQGYKLDSKSSDIDSIYFSLKDTKAGKIYINKLIVEKSNGKIHKSHKPILYVNIPIWRNNSLRGAVRIKLSLEIILNSLNKATPTYLRMSYIDNKGYYIFNENEANILTRNESKSIRTIKQKKDYADNIVKLYSEIILKLNQDNKKQFIQQHRDNGDFLINIHKVYYDSNNLDNYFGVGLEVSNKTLLSDVDDLFLKTVIILLFFIIVGVILSVYLAKKITNPLQMIIKAASDISEGKRQLELPKISTDEIGDLAKSFAGMNDKLVEQEAAVIKSKEREARTIKMASLGTLSGGVAHEINNPLAIIKIRAESIKKMCDKDNIDKEKVVSKVESIINTTDRIHKITSGLRTFAGNDKEEEFDIYKLSQIIEESLDSCKARIVSENIKLTITIEDSLFIRCLKVKLIQVITNMINNSMNAIKNLDSKWVEINVVEHKKAVDIIIIDSGRGIPKKLADRILEPFYTTSGVGQGMGLGLSISRSIVEEHNGTLKLDSTCKNTKFIISIPKSVENSNISEVS